MDRIAGAITGICAAQTARQLQQAMLQGLESFGFHSFNLSFRKKDRREFMIAPTLTNWASRDLELYVSEGWADRDPLLALATRPGAPLVWTPDCWVASRQHGLYGEYVKSTGIVSGATASLDHQSGTLSAITALSFSGPPRSPADAYAVQALGQVAVARAAVLGMTGADCAGLSCLDRLSVQQMEILEWVARGKSNADIAVIIGLSKRAVDYHVSQILQKLEVASKVQAVAIFSSC